MLVVNLFAGPGHGKSTMAAHIFAALKDKGIVAELVGEAAKDATWRGDNATIGCQPWLFGEQLRRQQVLRSAGVQVAVADSPLLLSSVYGDYLPTCFHEVIRHFHCEFDNLNIILERIKPYEQRGRNQTESDAVNLHTRICGFLHRSDLPVATVRANAAGVKFILELIDRVLAERELAERDWQKRIGGKELTA